MSFCEESETLYLLCVDSSSCATIHVYVDRIMIQTIPIILFSPNCHYSITANTVNIAVLCDTSNKIQVYNCIGNLLCYCVMNGFTSKEKWDIISIMYIKDKLWVIDNNSKLWIYDPIPVFLK